jgi:hypothetical protein
MWTTPFLQGPQTRSALCTYRVSGPERTQRQLGPDPAADRAGPGGTIQEGPIDVSLGHGTHGCPAHNASSRVSRNNHRCAPSRLRPRPAFGCTRGTVDAWPLSDVKLEAVTSTEPWPLVQHVAILESTLAVTKRPSHAAYLSRCIPVALHRVGPPRPSPRRNAHAAIGTAFCPPSQHLKIAV